mgnify:CR=1 FL=1
MRIEKSAGGIVFKKQAGQVLWLIRRPAPNPQYRGNLGWSWPKGWVDEGEKLEEAAIREVREEGGVVAQIVAKLQTLKVFFTDQNGEKVMKFITYFVMEYQSDAPEGLDWETAETKWATADNTRKLLAFKNEEELLTQAEGMVTSDHGTT